MSQRDVNEALRRMDEESWEEYLEDLAKLQRHSVVLEHATRRDYDEDHPGHPLGVGMPLGESLRLDGQSHTAWWMSVIRSDPCSYCGGPGGSVDHIIPKSTMGHGLHGWINFAGACVNCNSSKSSQPLLEFIGRRHGIQYPHKFSHLILGI